MFKRCLIHSNIVVNVQYMHIRRYNIHIADANRTRFQHKTSVICILYSMYVLAFEYDQYLQCTFAELLSRHSYLLNSFDEATRIVFMTVQPIWFNLILCCVNKWIN